MLTPALRRPLTVRAALLGLTLALALSGCGGGGSNGGGSAAPSTPAPVLSVSAATPSGLTATLTENTASIPMNGSVTYTVTLANNTSQPITYQASGGNSLSSNLIALVTVTNPAGVVSGLGGTSGIVGGPTSPAFGQTLMTTLAPGQSATTALSSAYFGSVFTQSGSYTASAVLTLFATSPTTGVAATQATTVGPLVVTVQ